MISKPDSTLGRCLAAWIGGVRRHARWVVVAAVAATAAVLAYTVENLGMNSDTSDMIAEDLPFRQAVKAFDRAFPVLDGVLVVVIDGDTPDLAEDAAAALAARLTREQTLFSTVYRPGGGAFFERNGLLYMEPGEIETLADNLAEVQPLIAALGEDPSLRGLFGELELAVGEARDGKATPFDLGPAFDRLSDAAEAVLAGRTWQLSWQEVISGETPTVEDRRRLILLQPRLEYGSLQPQETALNTVRRIGEELDLTPVNGVRLRLTGSVALNYDQLESARQGASLAAPLSFVLVAIVLFVGLRSGRLVAASLLTLFMGLIWTAGLATAMIGELNLVSVAFGVMFIGLGIDFSIHLCLRYRELRAAGEAHGPALTDACREIGGALLLCTATTAAGFYVFVPTDYAGVSELGLISGSGMFIALFANLTVLPALIELMPPHAIAVGKAPPAGQAGSRRRRLAARIGAGIMGLSGLALASQATFDFNPLNLQDPTAESVTTMRDLLAETGRSPWSLDVLAPDLAGAETLAQRLDALDAVDETLTIADFLPDDQEDKLALIEEIAFFIGAPPDPGRVLAPPDDAGRRAALTSFAAVLGGWLATGRIEQALEDKVRRLAALLKRLDTPNAPLETYESSLLSSFGERLRKLYASLGVVEPVASLDALPRSLVERRIAPDGRVRVQIFPVEDLSDNDAARRFIDAVRSVAPDAVGSPVSIVEAGDAVVRAFQQALGSALIAVIVLLGLLTRRFADTMLVMAPLVLALILTVAASVAVGTPFNFANVIVLPLLLGIGVDSAIHLVHRHRSDPTGRTSLLHTSTARAVVLSALTTICSFGSLVVSNHQGTSTMGQLLTIGVGATLLCTLVVLPAMLAPAGESETA